MSVYYVRAPDLNMVKIGFAENPKGRFSKIQSDSPTRLILAAVEAGDEAAEAARHHQFREHRQRGEWFRYEGALMAHVEALPPIPEKEPSMNQRIVALGISKTHASQIINGKGDPCLSLAVAIWRATGWKCQRIAHVTDEHLAIVEEVEPWVPAKAKAA